MAGIDLTDRIRMLDRLSQRGAVPTSKFAEPIEKDPEEKAEEAVLTLSNIENTTPVAEPEKNDVPKWAQELIDAVNELKTEITKMNKHVNSIQKFIKKA